MNSNNSDTRLSMQQRTILKLIDKLPWNRKRRMEAKMALVCIWLWPEKYLSCATVDANACALAESFIWIASINHPNGYFTELSLAIKRLG